MRIGFDFDNTIVSYDALFHKIAVEQNIIPVELPQQKIAVRDYLRAIDKEDLWTNMQGYVYGARMMEAIIYSGVIETMQRLNTAGHTLYIISHKTQYPYQGACYDLHGAARQWISHYLCIHDQSIIPHDQIFFEVSKENKLNRIEELHCDIFLDDLPDIVLAKDFPKLTKAYLFDPDHHHKNLQLSGIKTVSSWEKFEREIFNG